MAYNLFRTKPFVIFLMGPTAIGKTSLAIQLSKYIPVELISVDSGMVYKYMDIGTAKPNSNELTMVPHRLIDIKDPLENYTVANFYNDALEEISKILSIGKIPVLVGGSMLYYKILLSGLADLPQSNLLLRSVLLKEHQAKGNGFLHRKLQLLDPISAKKLHPNDIQRIIRALEVFRLTGFTYSKLLESTYTKFSYDAYQFVIYPLSKEWLNKKIRCRFYKMLENGFKQEVDFLIHRGGLTLNLSSMRCVGYRQMWLYLHNKITYNEMKEKTIIATQQLAKRQMTWLRKWKNLYYLDPGNDQIAIEYICNVISKSLF